MKLYHISKDTSHDGNFHPRIPEHRHGEGEDSTTQRISFASSVEGCFTAFPGGGSRLDETQMLQKGYYRLFILDTQTIDPGFVIGPDELYRTGLVPDAQVTQEYWVTCPLELGEGTLIHVSDWEEDWQDLFTSEQQVLLEKAEEEGDDETVEELVEDATNVTLIKNVRYTDMAVAEGTFFFSVDSEEEGRAIIEALADMPVTVELDHFEVVVTTEGPVDLTTVQVVQASFGEGVLV